MEQFYVIRREEKSIDNAGDHPIEVLAGPYKTRADAELFVQPAKRMSPDSWEALVAVLPNFFRPRGKRADYVYYVTEIILPEGAVLATKLISPDASCYGVSQYAGLLHQAERDSGLEI